MKIKSLLLLGLLTVSAHAVVTISGTTLTQCKTADGSVAIPAGSLGLLIVDTAGNGFFNLGNVASNTALLPTNDPGLLPTSANLTIGSTFGGETILNILSSPGGGSFSGFLSATSIAGFEGKNFAVVWFPTILASGAPATAPGNTAWGLVRGLDWTLPVADAGTFTSSATDASSGGSYFAPNATTGLSGAVVQTQFRTTLANGTAGAASFTIVGVPEPSAALLGALGVLGLLRRRRI